MTQDDSSGWFRLTLLWMASFLNDVFSQAGLNVAVSVAVLTLTILQIVKTYRALKRNHDSLLDESDYTPF